MKRELRAISDDDFPQVGAMAREKVENRIGKFSAFAPSLQQLLRDPIVEKDVPFTLKERGNGNRSSNQAAPSRARTSLTRGTFYVIFLHGQKMP